MAPPVVWSKVLLIPTQTLFTNSNNMSLDETNSLRLHVDPFSGAAGDMFLAATLDASPNPAALLSYVQTSLAGGMPGIADEFRIRAKRVWRGGMGSIAATHVTVWSKWGEEAAPVPNKGGDGDGDDHQAGVSALDAANVAHSHGHHHHHHQQNDEDVSQSQSQQHHECPSDDAQVTGDAATAEPLTHSHSHSHSHGHGHQHQHHHDHNHNHNHNHNDPSTGGPLRSLPEIRQLLEAADPAHIPPQVAHLALSVFTVLARAEASVHGAATSDAVHFHEVGAIDSIVDTIGTLLALHKIGIDLGDAPAGRPPAVSCGALPAGTGSVWTQHGQLPVPAFAAMKLLVGMPMCVGPGAKSGTVTGELVTPTGAALLRVLTGVESIDGKGDGSVSSPSAGGSHMFPNLTPIAVGCGAGSKDFVKWPNVMRVIIGIDQERRPRTMDAASLSTDASIVLSSSLEVVSTSTNNIGNDAKEKGNGEAPLPKSLPPPTSSSSPSETSSLWNTDFVTQIIANIDDMSPEHLSYATNLLLENGALDVWTHPIMMKKGRVAQSLNVLCKSDGESSRPLLELIFRHTTTLGVRVERNIERATLQRKFVNVVVPSDSTISGEIAVKIGMLGDDVVSCKAEHDDCAKLAILTGVPLIDISRKAEQVAMEKLGA